MSATAVAQRLFDVPRAELILRAVTGVIVIALIIGGITTQGYFTADNIKAIVTSTAFVGIIAVGATVIMLGGNLFSLSLGITTAVTSIYFLFALKDGLIFALITTLLIGIAIFAIQGGIVGSIGANPIIVTIGAGALQEGLTTWRQAGNISPPHGADIDWLAKTIGGIPFSVFVFAGVALVVGLFIARTRWGREIMLVGENRGAARAAGMPVAWLTTLGFAIAGACVAVSGILIAGFNQNSNLATQGTFTFDATAAILVGGNAVTGGYGSIGRTVIGALVIAAISDMLLLRGADTGVQVAVKGVIVIVVVMLVHLARKEGKTA